MVYKNLALQSVYGKDILKNTTHEPCIAYYREENLQYMVKGRQLSQNMSITVCQTITHIANMYHAMICLTE